MTLTTIWRSQSWKQRLFRSLEERHQHFGIFNLAALDDLFGKDLVKNHRRRLGRMSLEFQPMGRRLHHAFRFDIARARIRAFVAGHALPDDVLVAEQFRLHAHADEVDPVARIEPRLDGIDRARIGTRAALPATMNQRPARQRRNLILQALVVVGDDATLDERGPVARNIDTIDGQALVRLQVLRPDQRLFVNGHTGTMPFNSTA